MRVTVVLFGATILDLSIGDDLESKPIWNRNRIGYDPDSGSAPDRDRLGSRSDLELDWIWIRIWNWTGSGFGSGSGSDRNRIGSESESESETETESETEPEESETDPPTFGYGAATPAHTELAGAQVQPLTEGEPYDCA